MPVNVVVLAGNVTRDPELNTTAAGTHILRFGIAVNDRVKDASGEWHDKANFFDCVMFGNRAESLARFMRKGLKITVSGRLSYSQWEKDGQKRSKVEVIANDVELPPKGGTEYADAMVTPQGKPAFEDDIPF